MTMWRAWEVLWERRAGRLLRVERRERGIGEAGVRVRRWIEGEERRVERACGIGFEDVGVI